MADLSDRDARRTGATRDTTGRAGISDWSPEEQYWRDNFASRPYAHADRGFDYYRPGYRYGFESAQRFHGKQWNDVESDLRSGWDRYEHRAQSTWENVKDAVRDAWNRVIGKV
jgi:hypothetical protein